MITFVQLRDANVALAFGKNAKHTISVRSAKTKKWFRAAKEIRHIHGAYFSHRTGKLQFEEITEIRFDENKA